MKLHVACLPYPSYQGTQAAIDAMLRASAVQGEAVELLTYAHGAYPLEAPYAIHRIGDFPKVRSLRSGPSWGKLLLDGRCIAATRSLVRRLRPEAIIAHHIEAALVALAARAAPVYYLAHTSLPRELPVYFPKLHQEALRLAGGLAEDLAAQQARGVGAVAPSLAFSLGRRAVYVPVPWMTTACPLPRAEARRALALPVGAPICLYAGNLDAYQSWEILIEATWFLRREQPRAKLLIATESNPAPAWREAARCGVADAVFVRRLDGEQARALTHAASDVAWVPRRTEGGLPIKMLDAFARELPVVAMERATAGLPIHDACEVVRNDDSEALARAAAHLFEHPGLAEQRRDRARRYLIAEHGPSAHVDAMRAMLGVSSATSRTARRSGRRLRAAPGLRAR